MVAATTLIVEWWSMKVNGEVDCDAEEVFSMTEVGLLSLKGNG